MTQETFAASLGAIRQAGSVYGLIFSRGQELLFRDAPYPEGRTKEIVTIMDDIARYFEQERRGPDQFVFGYDGGNFLLLLIDEFRLAVLHRQPEEADFVARVARAFLKDYAMGQLALASAGAPSS